MAIRCRNNEEWPNTHEHITAEEVRLCYLGGDKSPVVAGPFALSAPTAPPEPPAPAPVKVRMVSDRQLQYVDTYGGDYTYASKLTYDEAYEYVAKLIREHREKRDAERAKKKERSMDPRLKLIDGMIDMIPEGRYATAPEGAGGHIDFVRIVRVNKMTRKYPAGTLKIQTQHSDVWRTDAVRWPTNSWSVYRPGVIEQILLVITDHRTCARRYGIEVQACQKCGKKLTDDRSRHYLIGPECETKYGGSLVIEEVDDINDGFSFEQLVARGMPTRIWQDSLVI